MAAAGLDSARKRDAFILKHPLPHVALNDPIPEEAIRYAVREGKGGVYQGCIFAESL